MSVNLYTPDANVIVHETKVDFRRRVVQRQINLVQYDKSMPVIAVKLCSNGNDYVLPETASAYIRFGKRDHTYVYNECLGCDQTRTIVYFAITDQMTIFYGEHTPIVELRIGDTVAGSGSIPIWIDRNPIQNGDTESKSDLSVFEKAIEAAQKIEVKLPTDLGASATNLHLLTGDTKLGGGINLSGFEYDEATKTLKASGGGNSTPTILNLMGDIGVRTTITEEEKTNLDNSYYDRILYCPDEQSGTDIYVPAKVVDTIFSQFHINVETKIVDSLDFFTINVGEKNTDGLYPITVNSIGKFKVGGGAGGVSPCLSLLDFPSEGMPVVRTSITEEEKNNIEKGLYNSVLYADLSAGGLRSIYFPENAVFIQGSFGFSVYNVSDDEATGALTISSSSVYLVEIGEKNSDGTYPITINNAFSAILGSGGGGGSGITTIKSLPFPQTIHSADGFKILWDTIDGGDVIYAGNVKGKILNYSLALAYTSIKKFDAQGEETFATLTGLFEGYGYGVMELKKDANNIPQFKSFTTWLPPITSADEGKSLVVKNGNGQWATSEAGTSVTIRRW